MAEAELSDYEAPTDDLEDISKKEKIPETKETVIWPRGTTQAL